MILNDQFQTNWSISRGSALDELIKESHTVGRELPRITECHASFSYVFITLHCQTGVTASRN